MGELGALRGVVGLLALLGVAWACSKDRRGVRWRPVLVALALQVAFALLVLRLPAGRSALNFVAEQVQTLVGYADEGTDFVFGPLATVGEDRSAIFALSVLPVIVFFGALVYLLLYLRVVQLATHYVGGAIARLTGVGNVESMYAATVVFLGASEAPLLIGPFLKRLTSSQAFLVVTAGLTAAAGSTLLGYARLGAPLPYLLAATVMNAPAAIVMAKLVWPDSVREPVAEPDPDADPGADPDPADHADAESAAESAAAFDVRTVRDTESANALDAIGRGALAGGRVAATIGALLIAFVALIALANGVLGGVGGWFGHGGLTFQQLLGWVFAPVAWLLGVPWSEATDAGSLIGIKTVLNEFVAYGELGPQLGDLSPVTVVVVTFALAGFANIGSIAIAVGVLGSLHPPMRAFVARVGVRALLAATLANLSNAAIAGLVLAR